MKVEMKRYIWWFFVFNIAEDDFNNIVKDNDGHISIKLTLQDGFNLTNISAHYGHFKTSTQAIDTITNHESDLSLPAESTSIKPPLSINRDIRIGPCVWAVNRACPDSDITYYLYTRQNSQDRQFIYIDESLTKSNLSQSHFNPKNPTKIIIHGYNWEMLKHPLHQMKDEYTQKGNYNIFYVDWSVFGLSPCYMSAVYNTRHVGKCVAQLVERIKDSGSTDIHIIGFSLGAHVSNYIARNLGTFRLPRITGLDPALPLFITASAEDKLDPSDAEYVDILHTNAVVQGKLERCGHADFYMNGGILQPGCFTSDLNPFSCSHQRAPHYYLESIRSSKGFWGWACSSYIAYLLAMCPPTNYLVEAGENIKPGTNGMFLIDTNGISPYAMGKWTDLPNVDNIRKPEYPFSKPTMILITPPYQKGDPLLKIVDQWAKLDDTIRSTTIIASSVTDDPYNNYFHTANSTDPYKRHQDTLTNIIPNNKWNEYRRNLTNGYIDSTVFQVPIVD